MSDLSPKYNVDVNKSQGTVIGEHHTIYQYFQSKDFAGLSQHVYEFFVELIAEKTQGFVGRQFIFDSVDRFIKENDSGYFVIQGEPGIGKTALLAQLVKTKGYIHHFNVAPMNIRTPRQFLANVCAQLIARYDLGYDSLPPYALDDSSFLVKCLSEATSKDNHQPVVLVVDALDESDRRTLPPRVNTLFFPSTLPKGSYIIATSRPVNDLRLLVSEKEALFLEPNSSGNLLDIRNFIEDYIQQNITLPDRIKQWNVDRHQFVDALVRKSEGNFIYLRYVLPAIASGRFKKGTIEELPQGLNDYYESHWNQMQITSPVEFDELYAPIVCILAVAREPVTTDELHKWTEIDRARIGHAINQWREFLDESSFQGTNQYRIYHLSFQEFLKKTVDLARFDKIIASYYMGLIQR